MWEELWDLLYFESQNVLTLGSYENASKHVQISRKTGRRKKRLEREGKQQVKPMSQKPFEVRGAWSVVSHLPRNQAEKDGNSDRICQRGGGWQLSLARAPDPMNFHSILGL